MADEFESYGRLGSSKFLSAVQEYEEMGSLFFDFIVRLAEIVALTAAFTVASQLSIQNEKDAASAALVLLTLALNIAVIHHCCRFALSIADRDIERFKPSKVQKAAILVSSGLLGLVLTFFATEAVASFVTQLASQP